MAQGYCAKAACKMLVKLTTDRRLCCLQSEDNAMQHNEGFTGAHQAISFTRIKYNVSQGYGTSLEKKYLDDQFRITFELFHGSGYAVSVTKCVFSACKIFQYFVYSVYYSNSICIECFPKDLSIR